MSQYQKKQHSPTQHRNHHPIFISFFHLLRSIASSLFKLHAWQSFCTTSHHVLWSTSWSGALHLIFHTFLHPISVFFSQHMPIYVISNIAKTALDFVLCKPFRNFNLHWRVTCIKSTVPQKHTTTEYIQLICTTSYQNFF